MSALAAVLNKAVPDGKLIELYSVSPTAHLHLYLKSGGQDEDRLTEWGSVQDSYQGIILNPSFIAAAPFRGMNMVFAVTHPDKSPTTNEIALIAPVYQKLATTTLENKRLAAASSGDTTYVYYLHGTLNNMTIKSFNLANSDTEPYFKGAAVRPGDSLGACFHEEQGEFLVIFHRMTDDDKCLVEFNIDQNQEHNIDNTGNARDATAMAVTYHQGTVYVYYVDTNNHLQRVLKKNQTWEGPRSVHGAPRVAPGSQLTVMTSNKINHVFYTSSSGGAPKIEHFRDPVNKLRLTDMYEVVNV